jgi:hypothetical protein
MASDPSRAAQAERRALRTLPEQDGACAEAVMRRMVMLSRESAVAALAEARGQTYDRRRMLSA